MRPALFFFVGLVAVLPAASAQPPATIPVALYVDGGVSGKGPDMFEATAKASADLTVTRVKAADIRAGKLTGFRVLVMPGGTGGGQAKALEPAGRDAVKQFVKDGGCYVGICAGCYLASTGYDWSLDLLPAKVIDRAHWLRGTGDVKLEFTADAKDWLKVTEPFAACRYANGPILEPLPGAKLIALAHFREEFVPKGGTAGVMVNTPAVVAARYGKGWVIGVSPHPEQTDGLKGVVPSAIRWALAHPE